MTTVCCVFTCSLGSLFLYASGARHAGYNSSIHQYTHRLSSCYLQYTVLNVARPAIAAKAFTYKCQCLNAFPNIRIPLLTIESL